MKEFVTFLCNTILCLTIHLYIFNSQGSIDVDKELQKLQKNEENIQQNIGKLEKAMNVPSYESKVPEEVRIANTEKLNQLKGELSKLQEARIALSHVLISSSSS